MTITERVGVVLHHRTADRTRPAPTTADAGSWGILLFVSTVALVAVTCLDALIVRPAGGRLAVLVIAAAVIAERVTDPRTALGAAALAFALGDGFLQNHAGTLTWATSVDYPFLIALLGATAVGLSIAQARLIHQRRRRSR